MIESTDEFSDLGFSGQDIVDTGRLRDSMIVDSSKDKLTVTWLPKNPKNNFPYAAAVWSGYFAFGKKYIPGRKWDLKAIDNVNIAQSLADKLEAKGYNILKVVSEKYL